MMQKLFDLIHKFNCLACTQLIMNDCFCVIYSSSIIPVTSLED